MSDPRERSDTGASAPVPNSRERSDVQAATGASAPTQYEQEKADGTRLPTGALKLKELSGKHLRAINMHLAGAKGYRIAEELEMTQAWVSTVLNDPLSQAEIRQRFVDVDNEMFSKATGVIDKAMESEDEALRLRSAEMVWRSRGKFEKRDAPRTTAEDVVQRMLEIAATQGDASVTISATAGERSSPSELLSKSGPDPVDIRERKQRMPPTIEADPEPELKPWHVGYGNR